MMFTNHAEIVALTKAQKLLSASDFSKCTLYSICEPCPMCAFMMRELKIGRVVFALYSPHMGGYSRWNILKDKGLAKFKPVFSDPPEVTSDVLEREARELFEKAGWTMHKK